MKMLIGDNIREQRKIAQLTQKALAQKVGVSDKLVCSWESNRTEPKAAHVQRMLEVFGCSQEDLCRQIHMDVSYDEYLLIESYRSKSPAERKQINRLLAYVNALNMKEK